MRNRLLALFSALVVLGLATTASASHSYRSGKVEYIDVYRWGKIHVRLEGNEILCHEANKTVGDIVPGQHGVTEEGARNMLSILTAAKLAGRTVRLYVDDNPGQSGACVISFVRMY